MPMWKSLLELCSTIHTYKAETRGQSTYSFIQPPGKIIKPGGINTKRGRPSSKNKINPNLNNCSNKEEYGDFERYESGDSIHSDEFK